MKHINKFNEVNEGKEIQLNMYNHLTDKEMKLLLLLLEDLIDIRSDMSCNDPYKKEERLFSKSERKEMLRLLGETNYMSPEDAEDLDGDMYNTNYPAYIKYKLKSQMP